MVWDNQSETLVGNTVYDLPDPAAVGKSIVLATFSAEYVGGPQVEGRAAGHESLGGPEKALRGTHN
jgi:hypothetical protein